MWRGAHPTSPALGARFPYLQYGFILNQSEQSGSCEADEYMSAWELR